MIKAVVDVFAGDGVSTMPQHFVFNGQPHERPAAENAVFGHVLTDLDYGDIGGDLLGDANVEAWYNQPWSVVNGIYRIKIRTSNRVASTTIRMIPGRFEFSECVVHAPNRKTGALILYRVARAAMDRGFAIITGSGEKAANAQGQPISWGFYTSPRMGFDADIPAATPALPPALAGCTRLSHLMASAPGRAFWRNHGVKVPYMEFDLAANSLSWQTLLNYLT